MSDFSNPPKNSSNLTDRERLLVAIEMMQFGIDLMRQNLRRQNPQASEEEIGILLQSWLCEAPAGLKHMDYHSR